MKALLALGLAFGLSGVACCAETGPTTDPDVAIANAIAAWDKAGSVRYDGTILIDNSFWAGAMRTAQSGTVSGAATWRGEPAWSQVINTKYDARLPADAWGKDADDESSYFEVRALADGLYQRFDDETSTSNAPGVFGAMAGGRWVMTPWAADLTPSSERFRQSTGFGPELLKELGRVTYVGREDVGGVSMRRFRAKGDPTKANGSKTPTLSNDFGVNSATAIIWLDDHDVMQQLVLEEQTGLRPRDWAAAFAALGSARTCPETLTSTTTTSTSARDSAPVGSDVFLLAMRSTIRLRLSDHGTQVRIEAPPKDEVTDGGSMSKALDGMARRLGQAFVDSACDTEGDGS
jgi:hypothetical protein